MTGKERIALLLWERFSPEHDVDPANSLRGEYPMVADDVMKVLQRQEMTSDPSDIDHVRRLVMWLDVVEEIHGEFKGGAKEALEEARERLSSASSPDTTTHSAKEE